MTIMSRKGLVAAIAPAIAAGGLGVVGMATLAPATPAGAVEVEGTKGIYNANSVNVRSCPSTACAVIERYNDGDAVCIPYAVDGQDIDGNKTWYSIYSNGYSWSGYITLTDNSCSYSIV